MIVKKAEFKVKKDKVNDALAAIRVFVRAVREEEAGCLRYESYQHVDDPKQFLHLMVFSTKSAEEAHWESEHAKRFVKSLYPNCEQEPVFTDIQAIE